MQRTSAVCNVSREGRDSSRLASDSRRIFLRALAAALLPVAGSSAWSQGRQPRVGYISLRPGPNEFEQAFLRGLRERGFAEGRNVSVHFRWAAFDEQRYRAMAAELVALQPSVLVVADATRNIPMIRALNRLCPSLLRPCRIRSYKTSRAVSLGPTAM